MQITPVRHPIAATVRVPGSKSVTNRALLLAALADGPSQLTNALFADDTLIFAQALRDLGFEVGLDKANAGMAVRGAAGRIPAGKAEIHVGSAGTAARFLTAFLALGQGEFLIDGDPRMRERPMAGLIGALQSLGAQIENESESEGLPLRIRAAGLRGGPVRMKGNVSSQFVSALLMVAPYAQSPVVIDVVGALSSRRYVELTLAMMSDFSVHVGGRDKGRFEIQPGRYRPQPNYRVEADASSASYFFAAAAILGGRVRVEDLSRHSWQADVAFVDVLGQMGCLVESGEDFIEVTGPGQDPRDSPKLRGVGVDLGDLPDTAQTLAAIAPFASSPTRIRGIASSRQKETDRIGATCAELTRLGVIVEQHPDGLTVHPCDKMRPASVRTYNDHRMAMAFALIGLRVPGMIIENPGCVSKSFPAFFDVLDTLR
jgi:3-phosphoshikimate 1-carboxyvinyltransferase